MKIVYTLLLTLLPLAAFAQQSTTADGLFQQARTAAFEHKDYPTAIALAKQALKQSPDYTDVAVFLGRLYTWNKNLPEARVVFAGLEEKEVKDQDFYLAYASLEYWNEEENRALQILDKGLALNPQSEPLWLLKAKIYNSMNRYEEAEQAVARLLQINPSHTEGRELLVRLNDMTSRNAVGITYGYTHFDKQFNDDWQMLGLSYKRVTPIGSVILKGNLANKFGETGTQIELEAYPRISDMFYLYVGGAYSNDVGIFPKYRTGVSLNANLPKSFEAEIGYRQLYFSDQIWLYTAAVGKYYKNYWFNLRTYISPDSRNISHSYTGTVRYYFNGAQDYIAFQAGTGLSPEENRNNLLDSETYKLKTFKLGAEYNFSVKKTNLFSIGAMYFNQEYRPSTKGNQFDLSLGYTKKF
ncbi:MAG: YaiO family outer membrane beta-barrel protein [Weeksellaceae bacterium]|nr:YaiO family outer membrane beta-barrel protein [Weeksellaceae bacterium]